MLYQLDLTSAAASKKVKLEQPADLGILEKYVEDFFATHIHELIPEDQLMIIAQERSRQEEADLLALDRKGVLFIFELKRWQSNPENLLQVMRYGQIFGRYSYEDLQDLAQRHNRLEGSLAKKHREYFELDEVLPQTAFNADQVFVVVTNGVDKDTLGAIQYWKKKNVRIDFLTYKLYSLAGKPHLYYDTYNPEFDVIQETNPGVCVVNTNVSYMEDAWRDMMTAQKAAAYYDRKYAVTGIQKGFTVYLYHTGVGVIAKGKAKGPYRKTDFDGDKDAEYFVPLTLDWALSDPDNWKYAITAREINKRMNSGYRFRQTVFGIAPEMAEAIDSLWEQHQKELESASHSKAILTEI